MARSYETALAELENARVELEALEREVEYLTPKIYEPEYDY